MCVPIFGYLLHAYLNYEFIAYKTASNMAHVYDNKVGQTTSIWRDIAPPPNMVVDRMVDWCDVCWKDLTYGLDNRCGADECPTIPWKYRGKISSDKTIMFFITIRCGFQPPYNYRYNFNVAIVESFDALLKIFCYIHSMIYWYIKLIRFRCYVEGIVFLIIPYH